MPQSSTTVVMPTVDSVLGSPELLAAVSVSSGSDPGLHATTHRHRLTAPTDRRRAREREVDGFAR